MTWHARKNNKILKTVNPRLIKMVGFDQFSVRYLTMPFSINKMFIPNKPASRVNGKNMAPSVVNVFMV